MEKKQTAMQQLLEWVNKMPKVPMSRDLLVSKILIGMEVEKSNIVEAWNSAEGGDSYLTGEDYYNQTFS